VEEAVPEMEAYYTFTWAPKPRVERKPYRPERAKPADGAPVVEGEKPRGDRPRGDRPKGDKARFDKPRGEKPEGDKPQGDRPQAERPPRNDKLRGEGYKGKGKPDGKGNDRPQQFEARPPRYEKPIDPDNPFAALLALKGKV